MAEEATSVDWRADYQAFLRWEVGGGKDGNWDVEGQKNGCCRAKILTAPP